MNWIWCLIFIRYVDFSGGGEEVEDGHGMRCGCKGEEGDMEGRRTSANGDEQQVYAILDEVFLAGEIEETSKQVVLTRLEHLDKLE